MTCLVVDIGNTSTSVAVGRRGGIRWSCHLPSRRQRLLVVNRLVHRALRSAAVERAVICSVVPRLTPLWHRALRHAGIRHIVRVSATLELGVRLRYPRPETLGADRLANICEAAALYPRRAVLVMDIGTATTIDAIAANGSFIGGIIAPGPGLMSDYLADQTAQLPHVRWGGARTGIGRSTRAAIRIGMQAGYRGLVLGIVEAARSTPGFGQAKLCVTGGFARRVMQGLNLPCRLDPHLTLRGLVRLCDLNGPGRGAA